MSRGATLRILLFPVFACISPLLYAAPASAYLSPAALRSLEAGEELRAASVGKGASLSIAPDHPAATRLRAELAGELPDVVVEALFLWKKPKKAGIEDEKLAAYNILRSVGSLTGIEYYSASRKTMRLFYEYSSLVSGPDGKLALPDSALGAVPLAETLYARQKDLSFGDNIYRYEFSSGEDYVRSLSVNLNTMRYGIVPVAQAEGLRVRSLALFTDDAILFYAVSSAKATVVPGVRGKLEDSFGNRAEAIYAWFAAKAALAWQKL
ncbi:MAG TPA: hypothetical protein DCG47_04330 [Spirochaetaceae bacterium]|jgi:hypothetical protein|nr:hypothetical protein [Spirochaetaceae bacterium]